MGEPRFFELVRHEDETGVSGTGVVALGVEGPNGQVIMGWRVDGHSTSAYDSIETVREIHGHNGRTEIRWLDHPGTALGHLQALLVESDAIGSCMSYGTYCIWCQGTADDWNPSLDEIDHKDDCPIPETLRFIRDNAPKGDE